MTALTQLHTVTKCYGKKKILNDITLTFHPGEIHCLLGPSGAGKTTTIGCLLGITNINEGEVTVLGEKMPNRKVLKNVGYMGQNSNLYEELSALDNLTYFGMLKGIPKKQLKAEIQKNIEMVGLSNSLHEAVKHFSGGMKTRLSLAITLLGQPKILILDEPTVGIDPQLRIEIWNQLQHLAQEGTTIIMTTHMMDEAEKSDKISFIMQGEVFESGSPAALKEKYKAETIETVFLKAEERSYETNQSIN